MRAGSGELRIGMIGAGTMAGGPQHRARELSPSSTRTWPCGRGSSPSPTSTRRSRASSPNGSATNGSRADWRSLVAAEDIDLVVVCLPPVVQPRGRPRRRGGRQARRVREAARRVARASPPRCSRPARTAGVFHGLAAGYRWSPAVRAIAKLIRDGELGTIRSLRASFMLDYAADPDVPLLWRFRRDLAGGGIAIDTGYHLVDCARFLVGEIETVQAIADDLHHRAPAAGRRRRRQPRRRRSAAVAAPESGPVDVEDAVAALVTFEGGAYGVLETSRVAIGKRLSLQLEVYGSLGSADWDLERPDEFRVCLPGDPSTFGFRRVLVNPGHPGAGELLIGGTDGTSIGWLGQECAMWAEFLDAIGDGRPGSADFTDGVRDSAVIDALYAAAVERHDDPGRAARRLAEAHGWRNA